MVRSKVKHHYPASYIPWEEMKSLVNCLISQDGNRKRIGLYIALGAFLGLRHSDIVRLSWKDLAEDEITLNEKKTGKERVLTISPDLRKIINTCRPENLFSLDVLVFSNGKGVLSSQGLNQMFKKLKEQYNLSVKHMSLHSPRKTFGRHFWEINNKSDESLILLSECFKHSNTVITKKYLGITSDEIKNIYLSL